MFFQDSVGQEIDVDGAERKNFLKNSLAGTALEDSGGRAMRLFSTGIDVASTTTAPVVLRASTRKSCSNECAIQIILKRTDYSVLDPFETVHI